MALTKGTLRHYVTGPSLTEVRIDTPNVWLTPSHEGVYEISVDGPGKSQIIAEAGSIAVFAAQGHEWVDAGQKMLVRGDASNPQFKLSSALTAWKRLSIALSTLHIGGGGGGSVSAGSDDSPSAEPSGGKARPPRPPRSRSAKRPATISRSPLPPTRWSSPARAASSSYFLPFAALYAARISCNWRACDSAWPA